MKAPKKKPHKHHNHKKEVFIHKAGGMDWYQENAQRKNIDRNKHNEELLRTKKGKLET